jgi:hypothetical protein
MALQKSTRFSAIEELTQLISGFIINGLGLVQQFLEELS